MTNPQATATGFGRAASTLPAINDRWPAGSAPPLTARFNRHKGNRRSSAQCGYPNFPVSSAAFVYNNPTTPYSCCQVVQRMGSTSINFIRPCIKEKKAAPTVLATHSVALESCTLRLLTTLGIDRPPTRLCYSPPPPANSPDRYLYCLSFSRIVATALKAAKQEP